MSRQVEDREVTTEITNAMADDGCARDTAAEQALQLTAR